MILPPPDPRTPEIIAEIEAMPTADEQVIAMRALCFAYPYLMVCEDWKEDIEVLEDAMHLTLREREDIMIAAARASRRLKEAMGIR